jgi:hypothetical protein
MTTAWVDLSNVCRADGQPRWDRYLMLREVLEADRGYRVRAIADDSLRFQLTDLDRNHLEAATRRGEVLLAPVADPLLIERVLADPDTVLVTRDNLVDWRQTYPGLGGFSRRVSFRFEGWEAHLYDAPLPQVSSAHESQARESGLLRSHGFRTGDDRRLLQWDWRCCTPGCRVADGSQLDGFPLCCGGVACCPVCGVALDQLDRAEDRREVKLLVGDEVRQRLALATGTGLTLGREAGLGRFDVSHLLEPAAAVLISRNHLRLKNHLGQLRVSDPGSRNGSAVRRADGSTTPLHAGPTLVVREDDTVSLAGVLQLQLSGRRWSWAGLDEQVASPATPRTQVGAATWTP